MVVSAVNNGGTFPDFVELANTSGAPVNLTGWSLTDDGTARKFVFPSGTTIDAGGYLTVWCDAITNTAPGLHSGFAFGRNGDNVFLYDANTNLADALTFGLQLRYSWAIGNAWVLSPTEGAANVAAPAGPPQPFDQAVLASPLPGDPTGSTVQQLRSAHRAQGIFFPTRRRCMGDVAVAFRLVHVQLLPMKTSARSPRARHRVEHRSLRWRRPGEPCQLRRAKGVAWALADGAANIVNFQAPPIGRRITLRTTGLF